MGSLLGDTRLAQIRFVVKDIEKAERELVRFFGVEEPPTINSGEHEVTKTQYRGEPAPEAWRSICFFYFGDLQMEPIRSNKAPPAWREQLEQRGEGPHRLTFNVKEMQMNTECCEEWGTKLIQRGGYHRADGRYSFLDVSDSLKMVVELLEHDEQRKSEEESTMRKIQFPEGSIWRCVTSSYQIEGDVHEGGRGEITWGRYYSISGNVANGENGDVASDHFCRYRGGVTPMKCMGMKAYRSSIAWPRILPAGYGEVNEKGVRFYSNLIDELLAAGIEPYITLYHRDLPQAPQDRRGQTSPQMTEYFLELGRICIDRFGGRVKKWVILNEPCCVAFLDYYEGKQAPGYHDFSATVSAVYHMYVDHGLVVKYFWESRKGGETGIALSLMGCLPLSEEPEDVETAKQTDGYLNRQSIEPIMLRRYPQDMIDFYTSQGMVLPKFQREELGLVSWPLDFIGLDYYNDLHMKHNGKAWPLQFVIENLPYSVVNDRNWPVTEMGFKRTMRRMKEKYDVGNIVVTENGTSLHDVVSGNYEVRDYARLGYLECHIRVLHETIEEGVNVLACFVWSFYDNFEWSFGYNSQFGTACADFRTQGRIAKGNGH